METPNRFDVDVPDDGRKNNGYPMRPSFDGIDLRPGAVGGERVRMTYLSETEVARITDAGAE